MAKGVVETLPSRGGLVTSWKGCLQQCDLCLHGVLGMSGGLSLFSIFGKMVGLGATPSMHVYRFLYSRVYCP